MRAQTSLPAKLLFFLVLNLAFLCTTLGQSFYYLTPICANGPNIMPITSPGFPGGGSYSSSPPGLTQFVNGQIDPSSSIPGTYTISYTGSSCSCIIYTVITVHALTALSINNTTVCASTTVVPLTVVANPSTGLTYTWFPSFVTGPTLNVFPPYANQTLSLSATDSNGCTTSTTAVITTVPGPLINVNGPTSTCGNTPITLSATGSAISYTWSTGATGNQISVMPTVNTTYSVTGINGQGCRSVTVHSVTVSNLNVSVSNATVCSGNTVTLNATAVPNTGVTFFWSPGFLSGASITIAPNTTQMYTVTATRAGCTKSVTALVTVYPSFVPVTTFSYNFPVCTNSGNQSPVLAQGFYPGGTFQASGGLAINDSTGVVDFENITSGDYYITYNIAAIGCTAATAGMATLSVGQAGKVELISDVIIYKGSSATLSVTGGTSYNWTPNLYIDCAVCDTPRVSPPESMQYCVSSDLCVDGGCVNVTVLCKNTGDLSVPNAFTPNNDGNNDQFCLQGWEECVRKFEILIFDRWGAKLFESTKPDFCWDGVYNGQILPAGAYTYVITASYDLVPQVVNKGFITIMR